MSKTSSQPHIDRLSNKKADRQREDAKAFAQPSEYPLLVATACAVALPMMCAFQQPPLSAFFNQALSVALWSGVLLAIALTSGQALRLGNRAHAATVVASPVGLWALLLAVLLGHSAVGLTPAFIAAPTALNLLLALLTSAALAMGSRQPPTLQRWLRALLLGILIAALFNAFAALVQLTAPNWADDTWIARTVRPHDRASGNLRQPNQLATLMVWGLLATSYFWRYRPLPWLAFSAPLLATLVASGSRTGMLCLLLIVVVALLRSRRVRAWRVKGWLLLVLAVIPLLWLGGNIFTRATADASMTQRLALWRDVVAIIAQHPWFGVGWGQLNFAWTLTPLPARAADVFDHAHNLPLHLAAELGVPLATLVVGGLGAIVWRARSALRTSDGATAGLLLTTVLLHSLFEYPLWFSYFLLPSAFLLAWLAVTGAAVTQTAAVTEKSGATLHRFKLNNAFALAAVLSLASVLYAAREYQKAAAIHRAVGQPEVLTRAIVAARGSVLFGHFGDYAAIMLAGDAASSEMFARPIRHVLDERLIAAYARMLYRTGDSERAAFVVARAREFPADSAFANLPTVAASAPAAAALRVQDFRK